jgi:hypothetical protein
LISAIVDDVTVGYFITITHEAGVAMREKRDLQLSLFHIIPRNEIGKELEAVSSMKIRERREIHGKT